MHHPREVPPLLAVDLVRTLRTLVIKRLRDLVLVQRHVAVELGTRLHPSVVVEHRATNALREEGGGGGRGREESVRIDRDERASEWSV